MKSKLITIKNTIKRATINGNAYHNNAGLSLGIPGEFSAFGICSIAKILFPEDHIEIINFLWEQFKKLDVESYEELIKSNYTTVSAIESYKLTVFWWPPMYGFNESYVEEAREIRVNFLTKVINNL